SAPSSCASARTGRPCTSPGSAATASRSATRFVSIIFAATWLVGLRIYGTRDPKSIGTGPQEYRRLVAVSILPFGVLTIGAFLLRLEVAHASLLLALPFGVILLISGAGCGVGG